MSPGPSLTVALVTQDQEALLPRLLENVAPIADEIVAVDGGSRDATPDILRAHPKVRYERRPFDTISRQKNHAISLARSDWVLVVDSDELLSDSLRTAVPSLLRACRKRWYKLPRYWIAALDPPRYVHADGLYPDFQLRLFQRLPVFRYTEDRAVHEHFPKEGRGPGAKLRGTCHIFHLDFLLNDRSKREAKVARYDALGPDRRETNRLYLFEDLPHEIRPCAEPWPSAVGVGS
jgi:glycosyltransferase involved in cell wall biosynthesis